jgi:hypothetical protein
MMTRRKKERNQCLDSCANGRKMSERDSNESTTEKRN